MTSVKIDSRCIGLHGPISRIWWIQNELTATDTIRDIQTQPSVRWGKVPFGAANCTTPSTKAVMAAKAWTGIAGAASSSGARLMTGVPGFAPHKSGKLTGSLFDVASSHYDSHRDVHIRGRGAPREQIHSPHRAQNGISSSMSLLRAPAATARRGAAVEAPKSPLESSAARLPLPPLLRPSSMVRFELNPCSTTSVEYFSTPAWSVHLRVCNCPSM